MVPRILIFSIAMGADYSFELNSIETYALQIFGPSNLFNRQCVFPIIFMIHLISGYQYRHADVRPWDPLNDMYQYERDYIICTKTKHKTPMIRTQSIVSVSEAAKKAASMAAASKEHRHRHRVVNQQPSSSKVEKVK